MGAGGVAAALDDFLAGAAFFAAGAALAATALGAAAGAATAFSAAFFAGAAFLVGTAAFFGWCGGRYRCRWCGLLGWRCGSCFFSGDWLGSWSRLLGHCNCFRRRCRLLGDSGFFGRCCRCASYGSRNNFCRFGHFGCGRSLFSRRCFGSGFSGYHFSDRGRFFCSRCCLGSSFGGGFRGRFFRRCHRILLGSMSKKLYMLPIVRGHRAKWGRLCAGFVLNLHCAALNPKTARRRFGTR